MGEASAAPAVSYEVQEDLGRRALAQLRANSLGRGTSPSLRLYPHQWSWDAACIAMGYARHDQERAQDELRSLFAGQWRNGMLPHVVFSDGGRYFPGPDFWQTERSPDAPARPRTSGIVQPPLHATAALRVYRHARDEASALAFLAELFPKLSAWHDYLHRERTRGGEPLVEVWHPWETGMDNSPLWDEPLERIQLADADVPEYRRVDVEVAEAAERPSDAHYDRYAYLVALFRRLEYRPERIRVECPFAVRSVLINAALVQADRDLAEIARELGDDPAVFQQRAERTGDALEWLWDDEQSVYRDVDVRTGAPLATWTASGLAPLYAGTASPDRAARIVEGLSATGLDLGDGWAVTSLPLDDPRFAPTLYWRGPVWPILNWFLYRGLLRYGYADLAGRVRTAIVGLVRRSGFWEHYDPFTGHGHGCPDFAWTAALVLDLLSPVRMSPPSRGTN
jgi:glycogen debranching enzyme